MGCGKTEAIAAALAPLAAEGVPVLMPSHRKALGQAAAERVGVPWRPAPGSDERQQGAAGCWDSWCPDSGLRISGHGWSGGALVLDEWAQACEHLLLSTGTALCALCPCWSLSTCRALSTSGSSWSLRALCANCSLRALCTG
jgi:hypothetical protein